MLQNAGFGLQLTTPFSNEQSTMACFVYVDDVDSIHSPNTQQGATPNSITEDMQRMLDTWAGALYATGGLIESSKS